MNKGLKYVRHEVGSHRHWKFKILRKKFDWSGEGKFWALNNLIAESDSCRLDVARDAKRQEIAAEIDMTIDEFDHFIDYLVSPCELIHKNKPYILSTKISQETLKSVDLRRTRNKKSYHKMKGEKEDAPPDNLIIPEPDADTKPKKTKPIIQKGIDTLAKFYGFNELNHPVQLQDILVFLVKIERQGKMDHFRDQFKAYREYKELTGEMIHGYTKFLNPYDIKNGAWNQTNWIEKLKKCKETKNPAEVSPSFKILE